MPSRQMTAPALQALRDGRLVGTWTLDAARSQVRLKSKSMWGLAKVNGAFHQVEGTGVVTADGGVSGMVSIGAASVDTGNKKRDEHLRSADFFEVAKYPVITFVADRVVQSGEGLSVSGTLTVRGKARPLSFPAAVSSFDGDELWLDAEVTVNRGDFGMNWNQLGMASMDNVVAFHAVFTKE